LRTKDTIIPHIALPFRFVGQGPGGVNCNEQDTLDDIYDCVQCIVRCPQGYRPEMIQFGVDDQTFSEGDRIDLDLLAEQIEAWEVRADNLYEQAPDRFDEMMDIVKIRVAKIGGPQVA